jgi:hypothetical protein
MTHTDPCGGVSTTSARNPAEVTPRLAWEINGNLGGRPLARSFASGGAPPTLVVVLGAKSRRGYATSAAEGGRREEE